MMVAQSLTSGATGWPVAAASLSLLTVALGLGAWIGLRLERDLIEAAVRAAIQLLAVGALFALIFRSAGAWWWAWLWVAGMVVVATVVVTRRAGSQVQRLTATAGGAIIGSALVSIGVTFGFEVIDFDPVSLVVVAGITIGNAVPSAVLGVNQTVQLCRDRVGDLEAILGLGFDRRQRSGSWRPERPKRP